MTAAFDGAVGVILGLEGGFVNDPQDPGGETKFGICKRDHPDVDITALTREEAIAIYRGLWDRTGCHQLPPGLAVAVFDAIVNQGQRPGIRMLQRTVGVTADGVLGPFTLGAVAGRPTHVVLGDYMAQRALRYVGTHGFDVYGRGWFRRLFTVHQISLGLCEATP